MQYVTLINESSPTPPPLRCASSSMPPIGDTPLHVQHPALLLLLRPPPLRLKHLLARLLHSLAITYYSTVRALQLQLSHLSYGVQDRNLRNYGYNCGQLRPNPRFNGREVSGTPPPVCGSWVLRRVSKSSPNSKIRPVTVDKQLCQRRLLLPRRPRLARHPTSLPAPFFSAPVLDKRPRIDEQPK